MYSQCVSINTFTLYMFEDQKVMDGKKKEEEEKRREANGLEALIRFCIF